MINSTDLQLQVWDKDVVGKDFLGEIALPLSKVSLNFAEATPVVHTLLGKNLHSGEKRGTLSLRVGFTEITEDWSLLAENVNSAASQ